MSDDRAGKVTTRALVVTVGFGVFAFGGIHGWASAGLQGALALLAGYWLATRRFRSGMPKSVIATGFALLAYLLFQLVPLPQALLGTLSPSTAELYRETVWTLPVETSGVDLSKEPDRPLLEMARADGPRPSEWRALNLNPWSGWVDLFHYAACGIALWLAANVTAPLRVVRGLFVVAIACAVFAVVEFLTWNGRYYWTFVSYEAGVREGFDRMVGPFINPDHLGGFLAIAIPLAAGLFAHRATEPLDRSSTSNEWSERLILVLLYGVAMSALVAALVGSGSRAALLAAAIGCGILWWGAARTRPSKRASAARSVRGHRSSRRAPSLRGRALEIGGRVGPAAVVIAVVVLGLVYAGSEMRTALDQRIDRLVEGRDFAPRVERWRQTLPIIADFPVFGVGGGSWREIYPSYRRFPVVGFTETHVHNDYVEWMSEVGIVGFVLTGLLVAAVAAWARRNDSIPRRIRWGLVGAIVAVAFHEIFDFVLRMPANALLLSVIAGLLANANWSRPAGDRRETPVSRMHAGALVAAGVCVVTLTFSILQLAEFLQWREVFWGSRTLFFASRDPAAWQAIGNNIQEGGRRWGAPAEDAFRKAIDLRPAHGSAYFEAASSIFVTEKKIPYLKAALRLDPVRASWRREYARVLELTGQGQEALAEITESVALDPRFSSHPYLLRAKELNDGVRAAVERGYQRALASHPDEETVHREAAFFYQAVERWAEASKAWERAAALSGDFAGYGNLAGFSAARAEDYDRAERLLRGAIESDPRDPRPYRTLAVEVFQPKERYDDARKILEEALRRVPRTKRADVYSGLGSVERARGDEKAAAEAFAAAARIGRGSVGHHWMAGHAFYEQGDFHRAKLELQAAARSDEKNAPVRFLLGATYEKLNDAGAALAEFERAAELAPGEPWYTQHRDRLRKEFADAADAKRKGELP